MSDEVRDVHHYWETQARQDPLWAVLSDPTRKGRKWDLPSFFDTGRREISTLLYQLDELNITADRRLALDFGCGVGRVTQALAEHFDRVVGVDISETMVRLAGRLNQHGTRVRYVLNPSADLSVFPSDEFSFIYTNIVLQHIPPPAAWKYLREFWRILAPGGLLIFQLPSHLKANLNTAVIIEAMPEAAYRAEMTVVHPPRTPVAAAEPIAIDVIVRNTGPHEWHPPREAPIRLGNHWLNAAGTTMLVQDDGRVFLPESVPAGGACRVSLTMTAPSGEGDYTAELDLVHESISWFKDKGSATLRLMVSTRTGVSAPRAKATAAITGVAATPARLPAPDTNIYEGLPLGDEDVGSMPMYGIPTADVLDYLEQNGAQVLNVEKDESCGREWIGYRYFVRKPRHP